MIDRMLGFALLLTVAAIIAGLATAPRPPEARCAGLTVLPACAEALRH